MIRAALLRGSLSVAVLAAAAAPALAEDLLHGPAGSLALSAQAEQADGGRPQVAGAVTYTGKPFDTVSARVDVDAKAGFVADGLVLPGAALDPVRAANDLGVRLRLDWAATDAAALSLDASNRLAARPVAAPILAGASADTPSDVRQDQTVSVAARLKPVSRFSLDLTGRLRRLSDALDLGGAGGTRQHLKTTESAAGAALAWTPAPQLKLQTSAELTATGAAWTESVTAAERYPALLPAVGAVFTPAAGESLSLSLSRVATPLDPAKFVALAQTLNQASSREAGALKPDDEWRVAARWRMALPAAARLELGVEAASLQSSTELMRVAGREAPGSVAGGERQGVDLSLDAPLGVLGLPALTLQGRGAWRRSQIVDPLTGEARRRSGEAPYEGSLSLSQAAPGLRLAWGVSTRQVGPQSYYGLGELSSVETQPSLGAFVEYRPAPFVVRLQVDDLAGGARRWTDSYYAAGRDVGSADRIDHREEGGPGFTLRLKRTL